MSLEQLDWLRAQGLVEEHVVRVRPTVRVLAPEAPVDEGLQGARRANQRVALHRLWELETVDSAAELARDAEVPESAVRALVSKGYAAYREVEAPPPTLPRPSLDAPPPPPAPPDAVPPAGDGGVLGGLRRQRLAALLPRLRSDLDGGRSVLVLAPEQVRLSEAAEVLASLPLFVLSGELDDEQRLRLFEELPSSGPVVVLGTYLALLAPAPRLGRVVVVTEAASASYKLQAGARLFVTDAAEQLARASGAALTLTDVVAGPETLVRLPEGGRRTLPLPRLRLHAADMGGSGNWPLHPDLVRVLKQVRERGRQAVLIAPRRGFSAALGCEACGWTAQCPNCDLSLRYHRQDGRLRCHQCGHEQAPPAACPSCGSTGLAPLRGAGTQWVAEQLAGMLEGLQRAAFRPGPARRPRAAAGGRAGRGGGHHRGAPAAPLARPVPGGVDPVRHAPRPGRLPGRGGGAADDAGAGELSVGRRPLVLVQTYQPEHPVLQALAADPPDPAVEALVGGLLERRRRFAYPPFGALAKLQLAARERGAAAEAAAALAEELRRRAEEDEGAGSGPRPDRPPQFRLQKGVLQPAEHL